jgi:hypothetical protein
MKFEQQSEYDHKHTFEVDGGSRNVECKFKWRELMHDIIGVNAGFPCAVRVR